MSDRYTRFADIPQFVPFRGCYQVDVPWDNIEQFIDRHSREFGSGFQICPDFQRGHVWSVKQKIAYIEFCLRGGASARMLLWNCACWHGGGTSSPLVLVDGLQRLTAVRDFLADEFRVFGSLFSEYTDELDVMSQRFRVYINTLPDRAAVLRWYLEINSGGVVHTQEELDRVRGLLNAEIES